VRAGRVSLGYVASVTWGLDALLALVVTAPLVSALRSEWPALGADALVAPGGAELLEFVRDRGHVVGAVGLAGAILALFRAAVAVAVDAWHARRLGAEASPAWLASRMLAVRGLGAVALAVLFTAAASPAYAIRHTPFAGLTTAGNLALACALALPALALALVVSAAERVARGYLASPDAGVFEAIGRAIDASRARTPAFRGALSAVAALPVLGAASAAVARAPYGVGLVIAQALLFVGAALRAAAFARAVDEARDAGG
jgi:hypothetical protein